MVSVNVDNFLKELKDYVSEMELICPSRVFYILMNNTSMDDTHSSRDILNCWLRLKGRISSIHIHHVIDFCIYLLMFLILKNNNDGDADHGINVFKSNMCASWNIAFNIPTSPVSAILSEEDLSSIENLSI